MAENPATNDEEFFINSLSDNRYIAWLHSIIAML